MNEKKQASRKMQSMQAGMQAAGEAVGDTVAKVMDKVAEGKTTVVVVVVPVFNGTFVFNREFDWEGGDTE